jgi:hypothetical protein
MPVTKHLMHEINKKLCITIQLLRHNLRLNHTVFLREHPVVFLVNNKLYTLRRLTQLHIYLSLATGFGLTDHLQAFVLYIKSTHNW